MRVLGMAISRWKRAQLTNDNKHSETTTHLLMRLPPTVGTPAGDGQNWDCKDQDKRQIHE